MKKAIKERLGKEILFFDGGMGSMIQRAGIKTGEAPERLNITNPSLITDIHKKYLEAGSHIITTNTFGAYSHKFSDWRGIIRAAVKNAKEAMSESALTDRYIAMDLGPIGSLLEPLGEMSFEEAYRLFSEAAKAGEEDGCDLVIIETIADIYEAKAAILAVKENTNLPVFCSITYEENGKTLTGSDPETVCAVLEGLRVDAIGINCGLGPAQIKSLFERLIAVSSSPIFIQPNAGLPSIINGATVYDVSEDEFAGYMKEMCLHGAWLLGGCCGTTPEHIKKMTSACRGITPKIIEENTLTLTSSSVKTVRIGNSPVIIGERINPTGKKKLKEALKQNDMSYILNEAIAQAEAGAHILDVNVGLPEINEQDMMLKAVKKIQEVTGLPLQIDSSEAHVIESALRLYNGKPLVNSVNGKKDSMEKIFPLVKKYGAVVVGLTLDENGIPETAEGRLEIAERIVNTAAGYGIHKKDILIDTLTLTVSAQQKDSYETIRALRLVKENLNVNTVLGVSNISFGLPNRAIINSAFFAIALNNGLSACIINPLSADMMKTFDAFNVLSGHDDMCKEYIRKYSQENPSAPQEKSRPDSSGINDAELKELIIKGLKDPVYEATEKLLENMEALDIINEHIVPALDYVGLQYEQQRFFLPQLIMSAEAAKQSFAAIKAHMEKTGSASEPKGSVLIATVEGDIHDIGKNIVRALLENYGYMVYDLGKDVPVETVVEMAKKHNARLVGLSALMTTTVVNMERTIKALRAEGLDCRIMVGGAVLNKDYAEAIGADYYCRDALAGVKVCKELFG